MELRLIRQPNARDYCEGKLYVNNVYFCDTLEDTCRPIRNFHDKIVGRTAIPEGKYKVHWTKSPRFRRYLPEIIEVPWFSGIRIHAGNTAEDTRGCILVGRKHRDGYIVASKATLEALCMRISSAIARGETVSIEVKQLRPLDGLDLHI